MTSLSLSKSTVNLDHGSRVVTITAHAADASGNGAASGVKSIGIEVRPPASITHGVGLTLSSGTSANGTWSGSYTVSPYGRAGALTVDEVKVTDVAGNVNNYDNYPSLPVDPTSIALQSGWDTSMKVAGTPRKKPAPLASGKLSSFTFSPTSVDTTKSTKRVKIIARMSGRQPQEVDVSFRSRNGRHTLYVPSVTKHSGPTWTGHFTVPREAGGRVYLPSVGLYYGSGFNPQEPTYSAQQVAKRFDAHTLTVTSRPVSKQVPTMTNLTLTKSAIDTTAGAVTEGIQTTLVDTKATITGAYVVFAIDNGNAAGGPSNGLYPHPGVGYQTQGEVEVSLTRLPHNLWTGAATFARCVPSGNWFIDVYTYQDTRAVAHAPIPGKAGPPTRIQVTSTAGDTDAPYVHSSFASSSGGTITLNFSEGVKNVTDSDLAIYQISTIANRFKSTEPISSITCLSGDTTVDCSGSSGLVTSAVLDVPAVSGHSGAKYEVFANQRGMTSQLTDGPGNPMDWSKFAAKVTAS